jgi:hypothetical protein
MDYITPPRVASFLLSFFAREPDFAIVLGDLSEEFQKRASAHGHAAARRWYWQESFRNAFAWIKREFLRTPVKVLTVTLVADLSVLVLVRLMGPLGLDVQWAWIPPRYWRWFQLLWSILIASLLCVATGAIASMLVRGREIAVAVSFAIWSTVYSVWLLYILSYSAARGRLPRTFNLAQLNELVVIQWAGTLLLYSIGCFWIRWHRISRLSSRVN